VANVGTGPSRHIALYQARLLACENGPTYAAETWAAVDTKLGETWSPEQISGYFKANGQPTVSHEAIYQRILRRQARPVAPCIVPCVARSSARSVMEVVTGVARFPTRSRSTNAQLSSATATALATGRRTWSLAPGQKQALVTMNERTSRYSLFAHVPCKTAAGRLGYHDFLLTPFAACVHTLTTDNGREFGPARADRQGNSMLDFFCAHPYSSWSGRQREHERPHPRVLPEENALRFHHQKGHLYRHALPQPSDRRKSLGFKHLTRFSGRSYTRVITRLHFRVESASS